MFSIIRYCQRLRPNRITVRSMNTMSDDELTKFIESRDFRELNVDDYKDIYMGDKSGHIKEMVEKILSEYEFMKYNSNGRVPSDLTIDDMRFIVEEGDSDLGRAKLFNYFFKREMSKRSVERKRLMEKQEVKKRLAEKVEATTNKVGKHDRTGLLSEDGHIIYGLWHNSLFPRVNEHAEMVRFSGNALSRAALIGRKLIFDFSYDDYMRKQFIKGICEQIQAAYGLNRFQYDEPFDIWFCNFRHTSPSYQMIRKHFFQNLDTTSMITYKSGCPTEYFDKEKLLYLSPNAKNRLRDVQNSDDIYIIGAYNDKGSSLPLSFKKAEEMGIRSASLPLDDHLAWKGPSKNLCVNHVAGILLELIHNGNDWKDAFHKHIPTRKVKTIEEIQTEEVYRSQKYNRHKRLNVIKFFHGD